MTKELKLNTEPNKISPHDIRNFVKDNQKYIDPLQNVSPHNYIKSIKKNFPKKVGAFLKLKMRKRKTYLVMMQLKSGKYNIMNVATSKDYFIFDDGAYHIDTDMCDYESSSRMNLLFYHQSSSLPIKLDFNMDDLRNDLKEYSSDVEKAVNPSSLRAFINSQIIEKVLQGAELLKDLAQVKMLVIINTLMTVAMGFILAKVLGWF